MPAYSQAQFAAGLSCVWPRPCALICTDEEAIDLAVIRLLGKVGYQERRSAIERWASGSA